MGALLSFVAKAKLALANGTGGGPTRAATPRTAARPHSLTFTVPSVTFVNNKFCPASVNFCGARQGPVGGVAV